MLVLALIVPPTSPPPLSGSLSETLERVSAQAKPPSAPLSLFHGAFPPPLASLCLACLEFSLSPAHTLLHPSDAGKIKGCFFARFCRHNSPPDWLLFGLYSHHQSVACIKMLSAPRSPPPFEVGGAASPGCEW